MKLFKFLQKEKPESPQPKPESVGDSQPVEGPEQGAAPLAEPPEAEPTSEGGSEMLAGPAALSAAAETARIEAATPEAAPGPQSKAAIPTVPAAPQSEETAPPSEAATSTATAPRHSWLYRFLNFLLGRDSRVGRIMRPFLRWTAAIVGLFALGLLAGYLLLYQPAQRSLDAATTQVAQQKAAIGDMQAQINGLQSTLTASNQAIQAAQDSLKKAEARNSLLVLINDVANARTALAQKDGAKVMAILDQARTDFDAIQPYLAANKKELADELNGRLETVRSVLVRDPAQAQIDLDSLYNALQAANDLLFG